MRTLRPNVAMLCANLNSAFPAITRYWVVFVHRTSFDPLLNALVQLKPDD
jgi:hypothetical protein